jgi:N-acetylmuramoyl-L-alanine amidase
MKRVIGIAGVIFMLLTCMDSTRTTEEPVIETVKEYPEVRRDVIKDLKELVHSTQHWDEGCTDKTIQISYEDAQRLLKIAYAEAGGEGVDGQLKVMQTVWNRVKSDKFPDTIAEVISEPSQFSSYTNGNYAKAQPTYETHLALAQFEANLNQDDNLIGFETNTNGAVLLKYFDYYMVCGNHTFYQLKKD